MHYNSPEYVAAQTACCSNVTNPRHPSNIHCATLRETMRDLARMSDRVAARLRKEEEARAAIQQWCKENAHKANGSKREPIPRMNLIAAKHVQPEAIKPYCRLIANGIAAGKWTVNEAVIAASASCPSTLVKIMKRHGVRMPLTKHRHEAAQIREMLRCHTPYEDIVAKLKVKHEAVLQQACYLRTQGLLKGSSKANKLTEAEEKRRIDAIQHGIKAGQTRSQVAKAAGVSGWDVLRTFCKVRSIDFSAIPPDITPHNARRKQFLDPEIAGEVMRRISEGQPLKRIRSECCISERLLDVIRREYQANPKQNLHTS
jgi:hypothetical protein